MSASATQAWLAKADEDEQVVNAIRMAGGPWAQAAYHLQQAAEKYVKAALVEHGIAPVRSHDLSTLLEHFPNSPVSAEVTAAADGLTMYAWMTRYPGGPTVSDADVALAEKDFSIIKSWALGVIH